MDNIDENIVLTENVVESVPVPVPQTEIRLVDIEIRNENDALNLMVHFLSLAQKRGAFALNESAKIWDCIKTFQRPV
jgi:hypothetical protein